MLRAGCGKAIIAMTESVPTHFLRRPQLRDPRDGMVSEAAVNGGADALGNVRDYGTSPLGYGSPAPDHEAEGWKVAPDAR